MYKHRICPICRGKIKCHYDVEQDKVTGQIRTTYFANCAKCSTVVATYNYDSLNLFPVVEAERAKCDDSLFTKEDMDAFFKDWDIITGLNDRTGSSFCNCGGRCA